jgi:hypothetical protein
MQRGFCIDMKKFQVGDIVAFRGTPWVVAAALNDHLGAMRADIVRDKDGRRERLLVGVGEIALVTRPRFPTGYGLLFNRAPAVFVADHGDRIEVVYSERRELRSGGHVSYPESHAHVDRAELALENLQTLMEKKS